jgi:hypothetical protein
MEEFGMQIKENTPGTTPKVSADTADISKETRKGGITLVLGAGISMPRGIPNWDSLARQVWTAAFETRHSPWDVPPDSGSPRETPQFLPMVFELASRQLGEQRFLKVLKESIYKDARYPEDDPNFNQSGESLAVIARTIVQEYRREGQRRINSIITLNADDMIEQAVFRVAGAKSPTQQLGLLRAIARPTHTYLAKLSPHPIPVYHIHGYMPSGRLKVFGTHFEHMLVFTDAQYWSTSASGVTFANRVMSSALSEGRCIFIGLSMTDINLLRWLALRTLEKDRDYAEATRQYLGSEAPINFFDSLVRLGFHRHFWIRPQATDPTGFLSDFLSLRGVQAVEIENWSGDGFQKLMTKCFPPEEAGRPAE